MGEPLREGGSRPLNWENQLAFFLKILEGDSPSGAQPVVAVTDPAIIAAVGVALARRLRDPDGDRPRRKGHRSKELRLEPQHKGSQS